SAVRGASGSLLLISGGIYSDCTTNPWTRKLSITTSTRFPGLTVPLSKNMYTAAPGFVAFPRGVSVTFNVQVLLTTNPAPPIGQLLLWVNVPSRLANETLL